MYYPLLRGKQEELLALQELLSKKLLSEEVIPIVEPVKLSSTLINTFNTFIEEERCFLLIRNPKVGDLEENLEVSLIGDEDDKEKRRVEILIENQEKYSDLISNEYVLDAFIYDEEDLAEISEACKRRKIVLLFNDSDDIELFRENALFDNDNITALFIPENDGEDDWTSDLVLFRDRFKKAKRNSDYIDTPDEFFSKDHIISEKNGYIGFSDYSIIGDNFDDGGFAPYAVAIHILYHNERTKAFRVRHFVSDTNHSNKNTALKFSEAVKKLADWLVEHPETDTLGVARLMEYYEQGKFPGLGSAKRFTIMHHLELIGRHI